MEKAADKSAQDLAAKDEEMREALATAERGATEALAKAQQDVETSIFEAVPEVRKKLEHSQACAFPAPCISCPTLEAQNLVVEAHHQGEPRLIVERTSPIINHLIF
jgi:hypothetical protein